MPSKYCPKCERIVSSNHIPNYCAWGCGSLKDQPLIDKDINLLEYLKLRQEQKINEEKTQQLKLF